MRRACSQDERDFDACVLAIARYASSGQEREISSSVVAHLKLHLLDTIGCAVGGMHDPPSRIAREVAVMVQVSGGASVPGLCGGTTPELAAFANTTMARVLDFNDTGIGGHPSDMILPLLALGETLNACGRRTLEAIFLAYEVHRGLRRGGFWKLRRRHVDQLTCTLATAMGAGALLGLDEIQLAHALSLALTPNVPLRVTRTGMLSNWKGCATAHGAMNALFAARLAALGMTGPGHVFEGAAGLAQLTGIDAFDFGEMGVAHGGLTAIEATGLKFFPAEYSAQGPLAVAVELAKSVVPADVEEIEIALHAGGWEEIGWGQGDHSAKWYPANRETADHSLPFLVARALIDGALTVNSFAPRRIDDPAVHDIAARVRVVHSPELDREHAGEIPRWPSVTTVTLRSGERIVRHASLPRGHPFNRMTEAEVEAKFHSLCAHGRAPHELAEEMFQKVCACGELADIGDLTRTFRRLGPPDGG